MWTMGAERRTTTNRAMQLGPTPGKTEITSSKTGIARPHTGGTDGYAAGVRRSRAAPAEASISWEDGLLNWVTMRKPQDVGFGLARARRVFRVYSPLRCPLE